MTSLGKGTPTPPLHLLPFYEHNKGSYWGERAMSLTSSFKYLDSTSTAARLRRDPLRAACGGTAFGGCQNMPN